MNFFKSLKAKLLGSIKEDLNSALGGQRASFNSKISGALDDLIAMKTGIKSVSYTHLTLPTICSV